MINPKLCFGLFKVAGFLLLFLDLLTAGVEITGFFLFLFLIVMTLLRWRFPKLVPSLWADAVACLVAMVFWEYSPIPLVIPLFAAMYYRHYWVILVGIYAAVYAIMFFDPTLAVILVLSAVSGAFLGFWQKGIQEQQTTQDETTGRLYQLQTLQGELTAAMAKVEQMSAVAERTRIARDIHDNAGHDFVSAYITLQSARDLFDDADPDALELYDMAMEKLDAGAIKIREAVHNLSAVTTLGISLLQEMCDNFPSAFNLEFEAFGDTSKIPMYAWNVLEACLSEGLTNITRHSRATQVTVNLDATPHLVRLAIENDGVVNKNAPVGSGLRNLRHRVSAVGGTISTNSGKKFRVVCVIPIKEDVSNETITG
ncbi:MAG: histidine kinase [Defluviitaleaceae bacterium]|nr:histidine kinase [Defluviitaleaceae bacterium]